MQSTICRPSPTIASTLSSSFLGRISVVIAASIFVATCAHASIPLPFTPIPLTLSNFGVVLVGMVLGPVPGFSAMLLYLAEGAAGLPVFSPSGPGGPAQLLGPTAGFLFSYPVAALIAGLVARSSIVADRYRQGLTAGIIATVPIFLLGASWLGHLGHLSTLPTFQLAVAPFILGEAIKIVAAAGIYNWISRSHQA